MHKERATNFLQIPKETLLSENYSKLSASAKVTYIALLTNWVRNPKRPELKDKVKVTYSKLIKITGLSRPTLWRSIKELSSGKEEDRFISEIDNHYVYCTNEYTLNTRWTQLTITQKNTKRA